MSIIKDDSRPWSWDCDPCGEGGEGYATGEDARQAADEHEIDWEAEANASLYQRWEREPDYVPTEDADYQEAECEILVMDSRLSAVVSQLIEIRELVRALGGVR